MTHPQCVHERAGSGYAPSFVSLDSEFRRRYHSRLSGEAISGLKGPEGLEDPVCGISSVGYMEPHGAVPRLRDLVFKFKSFAELGRGSEPYTTGGSF